MDIFWIIVAVLALIGSGIGSYFLGRTLGGAWMAMFMVVMAATGGLLWASMDAATGSYAGLLEMVLFVFLWAPILLVGFIGAAIGWARRHIKEDQPDAPS